MATGKPRFKKSIASERFSRLAIECNEEYACCSVWREQKNVFDEQWIYFCRYENIRMHWRAWRYSHILVLYEQTLHARPPSVKSIFKHKDFQFVEEMQLPFQELLAISATVYNRESQRLPYALLIQPQEQNYQPNQPSLSRSSIPFTRFHSQMQGFHE